MVHITKGKFDATAVLVAPLPEQKRIVDELERRFSHLDQAVAGLRRSLRLIESAKESVDHQLLWSADYPTVPLADLLASEGLMNGHSVKDRAGGFPVLRLTCLDDGAVNLGETKEGDWDRTEAEKYLVKGGDVLVSRGNGSLRLVGRGGLVPGSPAEVAYPDTLIRIRADRSKISPRYLARVWNSQGVRRQLEAVARTTAGIYKVNQGHLQATLIPLPELDLQSCLVDELDRRYSLMSAAERTIEANLRKAEQLRRSLLHAAFSGKLVPQDSLDEPASQLLARIQNEREAKRAAARAGKKKAPAPGRSRRNKELSA
jgi:type I restriction enzyme S subunit